MKRLFAIVLLVCLNATVLFGQDTLRSYLDRKFHKCTIDFAYYYRTVYQGEKGLWVVRQFHMNGNLSALETFADKKLKNQQGVTNYYHFNGQLKETGQYLDGKKVGLWKKYFTNGDLGSVGLYSNDKRDSVWSFYNINSKALFGTTTYVNGKEEGESNWYYESGEKSEVATYRNGKLKSKVNYDEDGYVVDNPMKKCDPTFIGGDYGMIQLIQRHLKYPPALLEKRIEGVVVFHFLVRKDGSLDNIKIMRSDEPLFVDEAVKVFKMINRMKPAQYHGQIVEQECSWPIAFRLKP